MDDPRPDDGTDPRRARRAADLVLGVDLVVAAVLLAFAGITYYFTTGFETVADLFAQDVPPEFLPRLLIWSIVVMTVLLPFEHLFKPGGHFDRARATPIRPMAWWTAALLAAIVTAIPWIGAFLGIVVACFALPILWGERRWSLLVPFAIVFPTVVMLLFAKLLGVYFEPGVFDIDFR